MPRAPRFLLPAATLLAAACADSDLRGPFFVTSPGGQVPVDETYEYDAFAAGFVHPVTWELESGPAGMTIDEGLVSWTPSLAQLGTYPVEVSVGDGETRVRQSWELVVHQNLLLGVAYSPRGHTGGSTDDDVVDHLAGHDPWGRLIAFHSPWRDSVADAGSYPELALFAMAARSDYGVEPALGFGWAAGDGTADLLSESDMVDNSWTNAESRAEFLGMVTDFARDYQPRLLFLGNEVNSWYWTDPAGWADWLDVLGEAYDSIKAVSPGTIVYTVFQLERLKGLGSGTAGWMDPPHWNLVDDVAASGKVDAIGFTSYPYLEFATPGAIPADYYDEIALHWDGPVIFTEVGWPAAAFAPFPGSEADQDAFVDTFLGLSSGLPIEYACWLFLHDFDGQAGTPGFQDIGLRNNDASVIRLADGSWQAAVELRERP